MTIFFTSDQHFFHENVIKYNKRPFVNAEEMNSHLIQAYNNVVQANDTVYMLGDFGFCSIEQSTNILNQLNGHKHLIQGNHDTSGLCRLPQWKSVSIIKDLKIDRQRIILCHYPLWEWPGMYHQAWHLYGHIHGNRVNPTKFSFDVGVDSSPNFEPYSYEEIVKKFKCDE